MTFVSYAQNFEDVVLKRALHDVERGFYVDVGAQDPVIDSVTKAFYLRGWHGINVEPVPKFHAKLVEDRPHDVNLRVVAAAAPGTVTFHEVADTGLSTSDAALAERHASEGRTVVRHAIESRTLDAILAEHAPPEIHFLKIDVEGAEAEVLRGLSLDRIRPWILVVESNAPNSRTVETHADWEPALLASGYRFVYGDGLNRFYLADEHADRQALFATPPNVWDDFMLASEARARQEADALRNDMRRYELGERIGELSNAFQRAMADIESLHRQHASLSASLSAAIEQSASEQAAHAVALEQAAAERAAVLAHATDLEHVAGQLERELDAARGQFAASSASLVAREMEIGFLRESNQALQAAFDDILASKSWRITRPMRVFRRMLDNGPGELLGRLRNRPEATPPALPPAAMAIEPTQPTQSAAPEGATESPMPEAHDAPRSSPQVRVAADALDAAWQARQEGR